jgi:RES domain-containing protein
MNTFESKNAFWDFARTVQSERRFIFDGKNGDFIAAVRAASRSRARLLKSGTSLFRAQTGSEFSIEEEKGVEWEHPLSKTRMNPDPKFISRGGRANPPGFAYLYLATNENTALAEMRPWVGETLTLAVFKMKKRIKLVICRAGKENFGDRIFEENPSKKMLDSFVWNDISRAFSRPVNSGDQDSAYLPTQILAEAFKAEGFDGLAYQSGLERGTNVVLFNPLNAKLTYRFAYTLKRVRYEFEAVPNYAIWRKDKKTNRGHGIWEIATQSP